MQQLGLSFVLRIVEVVVDRWKSREDGKLTGVLRNVGKRKCGTKMTDYPSYCHFVCNVADDKLDST